MNGKIVGSFVMVTALAAGAVLYYLQVYGYYQPIPATAPGAELRLTSVASGQPEPILADSFEGIDAETSPLRYRGCFHTPMSLALLTETYRVYATPTPLIAPGWFECFDASQIGAALETGEAVAFLSEENIRPGVDRVVAIYPDGRAYAWNQINDSLEE
ncbi:histidine kinase [Frigidibacter albus]|uniref:Histidine kinase n=2 Tax=Frigidibacter albus TaxID=1465486 RepID=A0A6L8VK27_9RHOB|nr:DUF6446 family protein [Frigidibacter albus]MZQ90056.1 histidine kinase [Frigidibacter albus]NBE31964.1 histidine kinase [Frigidibacter albus]